MAEPKAIEVIIRDEPIAFVRNYKGRNDIKLYIGQSGTLAKIRYEPADSFPGLERVKERLKNCPLCLVSESLNSSKGNPSGGGSRMAWRETMVITGSQHIGKGINKLFDAYVEPKVGADVRDLIEFGIGFGLTLLPRFVKMPDVADMALTVVGSQMTTKIWDYVERKMAPAATAVYAPAELPSSPAPSPTPTEQATQEVSPAPSASPTVEVETF